ncbi:hypothetical protein F5Y03DRAFT_397613 [Xylaria venustula]|nr:hypothetical protein F5Y03DRAFT_397613 [Xylaria venustula]
MTNTIHNGINYSLFIHRLPGFAAISISQLSDKEIPVQTWSNDMAWDKRQIETLSWDYDTAQYFSDGMGGLPGPWPTSDEINSTPNPTSKPESESTSDLEPTSEVS